MFAPRLQNLNTQIAVVAALASSVTAMNLTTHLLTKYAAIYHDVITQPKFFHEVLNGTVMPDRVAYFFEQDTIYGRGFTSLCGNTLDLLTSNLTTPSSPRTLGAINNLGETASGLAQEDGKLTNLRGRLIPGTASQDLAPSSGTLAYVEYMIHVSSAPSTPFDALVCSWTMGKAFVDVWTNIKQNQIHKPNKIPELQNIIDYWSSSSYIAAIAATGVLIDDWFQDAWPKSADTVFLDTLKRESGFWASVDDWSP